ncbi:hypothetical protein Tco_0540565 [Tanacetum coccineum]
MDEDQAGLDTERRHGVLDGPDPEPQHEDQARPDPGQSHGSQARPNPEPIYEDFMKIAYHENLNDSFTFGDQFIIDKSTEDASELEKRYAEFEKKNKTLESRTKNLESRVFKLELRNLPHKIDQTVNEVFKEAVKTVLQDPLKERFIDLSQPEHEALYKALEAFIDRNHIVEFLTEKATSQKRRQDDQDPPKPPLKDLDQSKKKRHNSYAFGSRQPPALTSYARTTSNTREDTPSSSKQKTISQSDQPLDNIPTPNEAPLSEIEETGEAHLLKTKPRPDWLRPIAEEDKAESPEPD